MKSLRRQGIFTTPRSRFEIFKRTLEEFLIGKNGERSGTCILKSRGPASAG